MGQKTNGELNKELKETYGIMLFFWQLSSLNHDISSPPKMLCQEISANFHIFL